MIAAAIGLMAAALLGSEMRATGQKGSVDSGPARTVRVGGLEVAIGAETAGPQGVRTFDLGLEAATASAQARLRGRSAKLRLSVRCEASVFRAENFRVYAGPHGSGAEEAVALPDEWLRGGRGSDLPQLKTALCAQVTGAGSPGPPPTASDVRVQLGSFPSRAAAKAAGERLVARLGRPAITGLAIDAGRASGAAVYRLTIRTPDRPTARAFCVRVRAAGAECLVLASFPASDAGMIRAANRP